MTASAAVAPSADDEAAALLLAVDPSGLGGALIRSPAGPEPDGWLALLRAVLPSGTPVKRLPLHAADDRLLGGLDLAATLAAGRPVADRGVLASADGGVVVLPGAERVSAGTAARIAAALDRAEVSAERDGFSLRHPARFALVALDEGIGPDERAPDALAERLAFHLDFGRPEQHLAPVGGARPPRPEIATVRTRLASVRIPEGAIEALCAAALGCGIGSLRAPILAIRAARAAAALAGRDEPDADDLALAARLVLAPRATCVPAPVPGEASPPPEPAPSDAPEPDADPESPSEPQNLDEILIEAIAAALPPSLLAGLASGPVKGRGGGSGAGRLDRDRRRGRPAGTLRGEPVRGARLNLVATLRAAAPWQALRSAGSGRVAVRKDDLRITRFKRRRETTTVFVVDASGSSAFGRLADAKGAVELLLADCYIRRDKVALLAFRGRGADLLLPPTRSLTRAKRSLAALPGGGGTPLAAAIDAACDLGEGVARSGGSAILVFLTDGRANVARSGEGGREVAAAEALAAARRLGAGAASAIFIDTSPRPNGAGSALAAAMGARYLPLPLADAGRISGIVRNQLATLT